MNKDIINEFASFDEYLRQGEPSQKESAENWKTAIGLQAVDGLQPSAYLIDVAKRNIEGEISLDETRKLIDSYYQSKTLRTPKDDSRGLWFLSHVLCCFIQRKRGVCFRPLTGIVVLINPSKSTTWKIHPAVSVPLRGLWFLSQLS